MKKTIAFCLTATVFFTLLAGCQATPEQPIVVQKDLEQMIQQGMGEDSPEQTTQQQTPEQTMAKPQISYAEVCEHYGVPERFQTTITEGSLTINCDVQVQLPDALQMPMTRVQAGRFSQEQVTALFKTLCGDTQMYIFPSVREKAYYEQEILNCKAELAKQTEDDFIKFYNTLIEDLQEQYEKAPEELEEIPCDGTLQTYELDGGGPGAMAGTRQGLNATSDVHNLNEGKYIYLHNDADYEDTSVYSFEDEFGNTQIVAPVSGSRFEYLRGGNNAHFGLHYGNTKLADVTEQSFSGGEIEDSLLTSTPKQARDIVEQFLKDAGISDMIIDTVVLYSSKREVPPMLVEDMEERGMVVAEQEPESQAYVFRLVRLVNGVETESCHQSSETSIDGLSFGKQWYYEEMTVAVDDGGIFSVNWSAPLEITDILTQDTKILPFSDIEAIFEKMIIISNMDKYINPNRKQQMDITSVKLSLQRIMEQDSYTTGLLVPVWNFYGTITSWDNNNEKYINDMEYMPILSINAINGSIIDVYKGY